LKRTLKTSGKNPSKQIIALSVLFAFVLLLGASCVNDLDNESSQDPFGDKQILVDPNPDVLFGNGSHESEIEVIVNPATVQDGSGIVFNLTGSDLPSNLRGCLRNADTVISGAHAFADYIGGIFIASSAELQASEPPTARVNVAASVTPPGGGDSDSNFGTVILNGVGMIPPEDIEDLVTNPADSPTSIFVTLEFQTVGIPPGTTVSFTVSRPDLGSLNPTSTPVVGSEESGLAATQYTTVNNTGGTQVVTARVVLPNPFDIDPNCPNVPEADRTIEEVVVVTQSVPEPTPAPTPTP
jgi:hypothetical protein